MKKKQIEKICEQMRMGILDLALFTGISPTRMKKAVAGEKVDTKEFEFLRILQKALKIDPSLPSKIKRPHDWRWKNIFLILKTVYEKKE